MWPDLVNSLINVLQNIFFCKTGLRLGLINNTLSIKSKEKTTLKNNAAFWAQKLLLYSNEKNTLFMDEEKWEFLKGKTTSRHHKMISKPVLGRIQTTYMALTEGGDLCRLPWVIIIILQSFGGFLWRRHDAFPFQIS
jgi:hypothetical protein